MGSLTSVGLVNQSVGSDVIRRRSNFPNSAARHIASFVCGRPVLLQMRPRLETSVVRSAGDIVRRGVS